VTPPPAGDPRLEARIDALVARLDLERKVRLLTGAGAWTTHAEPAAGLRAMVLSDGPAGVRGQLEDDRSTSANLPCPTALAATWDESLVERLGRLLAAEARRKRADVLLGPTVNLQRTPLGGRHFECLSEDPLLSGRIGAAYVAGVQAGGVAATAKHYVANDSETDRFTVDVRVDERALRELYLAPFERLVRDGGAWLVMAAYNGVNGATMTESPLLADPLKREWGFDGVVVSDWSATRSTEASARAALDLVMPGPDGPWGGELVAAVRDGRVPEAAVDDKVRRLLRLAARVGALEGAAPAAPAPDPPAATEGSGEPQGGAPVDRAQVSGLLRAAAAAGSVLVRNQAGTLPLAADGLRRVAVLGPNAAVARTQGGGSVRVTPDYAVSPLDGLRTALAPLGVEVAHALGARMGTGVEPLTAEQASDPDTGEPGLRLRLLDDRGEVLRSERRVSGRLRWSWDGLPRRAAAVEVAARLRATADGAHGLGVAGVGHFRLVADGAVLVDEDLLPESDDVGAASLTPGRRGGRLPLRAGEEVDVTVRYRPDPAAPAARMTLGMEAPALPDGEELDHAAAVAGDADAAVVVVGTTDEIESEGFDRASLALPGHQDELVRRVAAANPRTVVVVNCGGPVELPWRDQVPAILLCWFGGHELGNALADLLLGRVEPGGRLPTTWGARERDVPVLDARPVAGRLSYGEGIHVGYRAWARAGAAPAYPFGHGLGYTTWSYEQVTAPATVAAGKDLVARVRLRNRGRRAGREVVQAYLSRGASAVERPAVWLAGFAAVQAEPGETVTAEVRVAARAFQHWSVEAHRWETEPGGFELTAGRSVADRPLATHVTVVASQLPG
jgi:beta-glucosidase